MAKLKNIDGKDEQILLVNHLIGRDKLCPLRIDFTDVSRVHASIFWENDFWYLKDQSRNGTKLNGSLIHHQTVKLKRDMKIQFGASSETEWHVVNLDPPKSYLLSVNEKGELIELDSGKLYPNEEKPMISFYLSGDFRWNADDGNTTKELIHGKQYTFGNSIWSFLENEPLEATHDNFSLVENACLVCHLSQDEEQVEVKIVINELEINLGERVYNYLLYLLAKKRLADLKNEISEDELGWFFVEDLIQDLSRELLLEVDVYYLNVMIHRFRNHIKKLEPYGSLFAGIIERKRGKVRLEHGNIKILKQNHEILLDA